MTAKSKYQQMQLFLKELGEPDYRFRQLLNAIFQQRIDKFEQMTTLPKTVRGELLSKFGTSVMNLQPVQITSTSQAKKVLFSLADDNRIEAVAMKYKAGWESFCISSQAGCGFACSFCATGSIGLKRNLTVNEITDQLLYFHLARHSLDSISFMGMGEALANPTTFHALAILTNRTLFNLSPRRITVSTIGIIPSIQKLTQSFPQINLTFSLHSPFHDQRSKLMPINEKYPLEEVMSVLDTHIRQTHRKVYIAYVILQGINDTETHMKGIIELLNRRPELRHLYHVNLIRYNPTIDAPIHYRPTNESQIQHCFKLLQNAGVRVTIRQSFGQDIDAACGQLYGQYSIRGKPSKDM
ncbi:23S rRNA (adenine-C8)-methyltransferase [Seinonella peptonophila]|uniref:23S rRNA (Adenine-C8)-methyltransferase n=1 Tax=Seinonella peptonophila TaxID=112248 RepID=A0A1M4SM06_9BACL|nr:Cfr family 23S rRNA (adenine(2503)-C(8))-methyltransferase [Seinonella peptonophila]SHE33188.1 23S rRNA (adenine-C8)-methyltransferase [Seinonella peptonophila]